VRVVSREEMNLVKSSSLGKQAEKSASQSEVLKSAWTWNPFPPAGEQG
jgi:hypothetical protein